MNVELERKIVKLFVCKNRQERMLFELFKEDKRDNTLWHIEKYLDPSFMHEIREHIKNSEHLCKILKEAGAEERCYVMSIYRTYDEKIPLMKAIQENIFKGPYLLLLSDDGLAYYESEPEVMSSKYILRR